METSNHNPGFLKRLADLRHDLKTSAGHIIGYSEIIEEELQEDGLEEVVPSLQLLRSKGEHLVELIDEGLGASKANFEDIDLTGLRCQVDLCLETIRETATDLLDKFDETWKEDLEKIVIALEAFRELIDRDLNLEHLQSEEPGVKSKSPPPETKTSPVPVDAESMGLGEGGEILVVDDNQSNLEILERRLQLQGYNPTPVPDGQSALNYLSENKVDLILLDMVMPGLSGIEVLKTLKEDPVRKSIPVVMLSALDDVKQIVTCIQFGAEDYIFKPFNPILLKARISAILEKHRLRKQQALRLSVFISSAGDVVPERRITKKVIQTLNEELSGKVYLIPVLWEDEPLLGSETAQSQIKLPRKTDIYIGIFWSRMGTPLPQEIRRQDGSIYDSGSEFEYEDALEGYQENGFPKILVYRKTKDVLVNLRDRDQVLADLNQKELLEKFLRRRFTTQDGKSIAAVYHVFEQEEEFEELVTSHLRKLALQRLESDQLQG